MLDDKERKIYIPITYPFTVDKSRDQRDNENSPPGHMKELKNYIPGGHVLKTRGGITAFTHTPSDTVTTASATISGNIFSSDSDCVAVWKFENNLLDSIGGNHFTADGTIGYATTACEGSASLSLSAAQTAKLVISDANLSSTFPTKSTNSESDMSVFGFFRMDAFNNQNAIINRWQDTAGNTSDRSWAITCRSATTGPRFMVGHSGGSGATSLDFDTAITTGTWYWFCATYNSTTNRMNLYVWNKSTSALLSHVEETSSGDMYSGGAQMIVGKFGAANYYEGLIDELGITKDIITTAEMNQIRKGTYNNP